MWLRSLTGLYYIWYGAFFEIIGICRLNNNFWGFFKPILLNADTLWAFELMFVIRAWGVIRLRLNSYLVTFFFFDILHKMHHLIMEPAFLYIVTLCLPHLLLCHYFLFLTMFALEFILRRRQWWYIWWWLIKYFYWLILFEHAGFSLFASYPGCLIWLILFLFCRCQSLGNRIKYRHRIANVSPWCLVFFIDNRPWKSLKLNGHCSWLNVCFLILCTYFVYLLIIDSFQRYWRLLYESSL